MLIRAVGIASCSIPLRPSGSLFVAEVRIGSAGPFRFLFDTGATQTVITPEIARRAGVRAEGVTEALSTSGALRVERGTIETLRVGTIVVPNVSVLILRLPRFRNHGRIDGIAGMDVVAGRSFLFDVESRCLQLDALVSGGSSFAASEVAGRVALQAGGLGYVLDSAASVAVLMSERASRLAETNDTMMVTTASGRQRSSSGAIPHLRLGDIVLRDLPATVATHVDEREDALLPVAFFSSVFVSADRRLVVLNGRKQ